jgi:hypothetical protein
MSNQEPIRMGIFERSTDPVARHSVGDDTDHGEIQVVVLRGLQEPLKEWLASRGLYLFPIPPVVEGDLPTYGVGIG